MGFVFMIPLVYFLFKGYISRALGKKLIGVFLLAAIVASVGWIMVASGLINRPWVNAYKLSFHLILAVILFAYLLWICLTVYFPEKNTSTSNKFIGPLTMLVSLIFVQIFIGGMMSGMKAGLLYPTWPGMEGGYIPDILYSIDNWNPHNFIYYEQNVFMPTLVQFLHRNLAYIIFLYGLYLAIKILLNKSYNLLTFGSYMLISLLSLQVLLGILTLINCLGKIPLLLGVLHQGVAILLLSSGLFILYLNKFKNDKIVGNPVS
jgi:cytochrome c oxidase assembly protein subunit 15